MREAVECQWTAQGHPMGVPYRCLWQARISLLPFFSCAVMKRSRAEIQADIDEYDVRAKRARWELADHDETLAEILPAALVDRLLRAPGARLVERFHVEIVPNTASISVAAGTCEVNEDEWRCTVRIAGHADLVVHATRWTGGAFELPDELAWLRSDADDDADRYTVVDRDNAEKTWAALLARAEQRVDLALAGLAFAAEREGVYLRDLFYAHTPDDEQKDTPA
jgi:hypothetical protein